MKLRLTAIMILAFSLILSSGFQLDPNSLNTNQTEITITIQDFIFSPNSITLTAGEEVSFVVTNNDGVSHTFTIRDAEGNQLADLVLLSTETGTLTWMVPTDGGAYDFFCRIHPSMTGTFDINPASTTSTTTTTSDSTTSTTTSASDTITDTTTSATDTITSTTSTTDTTTDTTTSTTDTITTDTTNQTTNEGDEIPIISTSNPIDYPSYLLSLIMVTVTWIMLMRRLPPSRE